MRHGDNHVGGWVYEVAFDFLKRTRFIGHLEIKHTLVRFRSSTFATKRFVSGLRGRNLIEKSVSPVALLSRASRVPDFPYMITSSLQRWQRPLLQASRRLQVRQIYSSCIPLQPTKISSLTVIFRNHASIAPTASSSAPS